MRCLVRQRAAAVSKACARLNSRWLGQPDAMATLTRRTLVVTTAPIFSSAKRMEPQEALAKRVCLRPMRRNAQSRT